MSRIRLATLCIAVVGILSGCGHHAPKTPTAAQVAAVPADQWKSVINDWYDGHMDKPHSCAAVMAALEKIPSGLVYCGFCLDMAAYEKKVC